MDVLVGSDFVNRNYVRMIEGRCSSRFSLEALYLGFVFNKPRRQYLERNLAIELEVMSEVYVAHPAGADQRSDLIVRDPASGRYAGGSTRRGIVGARVNK